MVRKIIEDILLAAVVAAVIVPLLSDAASAQSNNGRPRGCYSSDGAHHLRGWCRRHGISPA